MPQKIEEPIIRLSAEEKKKLDALAVDIKRGEKAVAALREMGVDVKDIEEKIEWAKTARAILLKEFV